MQRKLLEKTNMQAKEIKTAFDELLTFDFYLRENAKSRPAWARDQKEDQKDVIAFYQREEQERRFLSGYKDRSWKQMMRMTHLEWFTKKPEEYVQILRGDKITEKESRTDGRYSRRMEKASGRCLITRSAIRLRTMPSCSIPVIWQMCTEGGGCNGRKLCGV